MMVLIERRTSHSTKLLVFLRLFDTSRNARTLFRREMLVGADRCLGDVVAEMLSTVETSEDPHEEAHVYLVTLFPQFAHIFAELKAVSGVQWRRCSNYTWGVDLNSAKCNFAPLHFVYCTSQCWRCMENGGLYHTAIVAVDAVQSSKKICFGLPLRQCEGRGH